MPASVIPACRAKPTVHRDRNTQPRPDAGTAQTRFSMLDDAILTTIWAASTFANSHSEPENRACQKLRKALVRGRSAYIGLRWTTGIGSGLKPQDRDRVTAGGLRPRDRPEVNPGAAHAGADKITLDSECSGTRRRWPQVRHTHFVTLQRSTNRGSRKSSSWEPRPSSTRSRRGTISFDGNCFSQWSKYAGMRWNLLARVGLCRSSFGRRAVPGAEIRTVRPMVPGQVWKGTRSAGAKGRTDVPKFVDCICDGKIEIDR